MSSSDFLSYPEEFKKRYELLDEIGSGDYGTVYVTFDKVRKMLVAMKIVVSDPNHSDLVYSESAGISFIQKARKWTDGIPEIYDSGSIDASIIKDYPYMVTEFMHGHIEQYYDKAIEELNSDEISVEFITMPYYDRGDFLYKLAGKVEEIDKTSSDENLGFFFELFYAVVVFGLNDIEHGDLNAGNVVGTTVDYKRQYIINDVVFTISSPVMPVIVDWAEPTGNLTGRYSSDMEKIGSGITAYHGIQFASEIVEKFVSDDNNILFLDIFSRFRINEVKVGDKIKFYEAVNF